MPNECRVMAEVAAFGSVAMGVLRDSGAIAWSGTHMKTIVLGVLCSYGSVRMVVDIWSVCFKCCRAWGDREYVKMLEYEANMLKTEVKIDVVMKCKTGYVAHLHKDCGALKRSSGCEHFVVCKSCAEWVKKKQHENRKHFMEMPMKKSAVKASVD